MSGTPNSGGIPLNADLREIEARIAASPNVEKQVADVRNFVESSPTKEVRRLRRIAVFGFFYGIRPTDKP